jgi:hypothetical protein
MGAAQAFTTGFVDTLSLMAAAIRAGWADTCVAESMQGIGKKAIKLRVQRDLGCYRDHDRADVAVRGLRRGITACVDHSIGIAAVSCMAGVPIQS